MKTTLLLVTTSLCLSHGWICGAAEATSSQPVTQPATRPATLAVRRGEISLSIDAQGIFIPAGGFEVRLRPKAYGGDLTILSAAANGAEVRKGDVLLEIDPTPLNRQLAAAANEATAAKAALEKAEADAKLAEPAEALALKVQQQALQEADDGVKWWEAVDGPQMLLNTDLAVKAVRNAVEDQQDELDQLKKMYKSDDLTNATADIVVKRAVRRLDDAKVALHEEQERADKTKRFLYPAQHQRVLDNQTQAHQQFEGFEAAQKQAKVLRQTGLVTARAAAEAASQHVADLTADLEGLTVRAPADGIVCCGQIGLGGWQAADPRALRVGEKVQLQQVLLTLCTPGKLQFVADLPEAKFFAVKEGASAVLTPVAFPDLKIAATCDPRTRSLGAPGVPTYLMAFKTPDLDARLLPGMKATVHIDTTPAANVVVVPLSAVQNGTVWLKRPGGGEEARQVTLGVSNDKSAEVINGLSEGDEILAQPK